MTKKLLISIIFLSLSPGVLLAALVPCGPGTAKENCEICDIFTLFNNIIEFVLQKIVPIIATLILVFSGLMFLDASGSPEKAQKVKSLITSVVLGLVIIYGAYLIISLFFTMVGIAQWTGLETWFEYPCH